MDNPQILATLGIQNTGQKQTKQNKKHRKLRRWVNPCTLKGKQLKLVLSLGIYCMWADIYSHYKSFTLPQFVYLSQTGELFSFSLEINITQC